MITRPELPKSHVLYDIARYMLNPQERRPIRKRINRRGYFTIEKVYKRRMARLERVVYFWWTKERVGNVTYLRPRTGLLARLIKSMGD
jgi:hypothetical protein